jgi:hypothetical protein
MRDRDHGIALSPEQRDGRQRGEIAPAVAHVPALAAPIDDAPYASRERARGACGRVHRREASDLLTVVGANERELANPRAVLEKHHPESDAATVGVADEADALETEFPEPRVARVGPIGEAVPGEIQHEDAAALRQCRRDLQPGVV